jgi:RHS repeat-associated protein
VKSVGNAGTPNAASVLLSYAYDDNSNRTSVTDVINGVNGATVVSQFDELNRLKQMTQTGASTSTKRVDFEFNAIGQYTSMARSNNADGSLPVATTSFSYDVSNRLSLMDHKGAAGTSFASFGFGYDAASRITRITEKNQTIDYGYDKRDQLMSANYGDAARVDEAFKFDANGNRVESNAHGTAYRTGLGNRLTTDGVYTYVYDAEGNLTKRTEIATGNTREFQWDHRNRLTMLSDKNASGVLQQVVRYSYDSLGRRISKQVDTTPLDTVDAAIEQYVYDGEDVILDFVDPDGSGPAASQQTTRYLRGPGIDNLLAIESASGTNWVLQDHLGSTRGLVSSAGVLVQSIDYDSFGKAIVTGPPSTRYLYTGRELDAESGLFYYRARYYDSSTGRFTNEDPIGFAAGDTNLGRYVYNSPTHWRDPFGNQVVFDRSDQTITFPDGTSFPASNNPIRPNADPLTPNGFGPAPNGTYPLGPPIPTGQNSNGPFGPKFSPISLPKNAEGAQRTGVGLHSGRANRRGYRSKTLGCVRTTDEGMEYLDQNLQDEIIIQD